MHLLLLSLGHKQVSIDIRETLSFTEMEAEKALVAVKRIHGIKEALLLSTCNRTELIVHHDCERQNVVELEDVLRQFLCCWKQVDIDEELFQSYYDLEAVDHIYRVSVGLESLVLGETQILGQLKAAYSLACRIGAAGFMINRLMHRAFRVGKRARSESQIGMGICSVSHAAAAIAIKELKKAVLERPANVLVIGAGEMALITAKELAKYSDCSITVTNRTLKKARTVAAHVNAEVLPIEELSTGISKADAIISAIGVKEPIITPESLNVPCDSGKIMVDIGLPRNISKEVGDLPQITLYSIDDLRDNVDAGVKKRQGEVGKVEAIINEEMGQFESWFRSLSVEPTIKALISNCEEIRMGEIDRFSKQMTDDQLQLVDQITSRVVNKILHNPIRHLKTCHMDRINTADYWVEIAHAIFDLDVPKELPEEHDQKVCPHAMGRNA